MATETNKYSSSQEATILAAIFENGNVANKALAEQLAEREDMRDEDGQPRKARAIIAKMSRMKDVAGFTYESVQPVTKSGQPVTKKTDLVARIAELADVDVATLSGMEKSPKGALETLVAAFAKAA